MIGERLKHAFKNGEAWVLSYREECFQQIGLKPSLKIALYNGSLECEFRKYQMFSGKLKEFREEGGTVKTEEEKQMMAEKRRTWQKRDYEKKREEIADNEEADILNFRFTSLEKLRNKGERNKGEKKREDGGWNKDEGRRHKGEGGWKKGGGKKTFKKFESRADRQNERRKFFGKKDD